MKKVGIVSCYFKNNYGSLLQAYATQKFLDNNNIINETISIDNNKDFSKGKKRYYLSQLANLNFIIGKAGMIKLKVDCFFRKDLNKNISIRNKKFKDFKRVFNLTRNCNTYKELTKMVKERYSDIIVGSDQLWLPVNVIADYYTLNWVPEEINKISYATSFGFSKIPKKYYKKYETFLNRIDYLSTREQTGVEIINDITKVKAKLVCDPTLLLSKNEWEKEISKTRRYDEKYIFCYFLGNNIEHRKFAERLKSYTGYKIVSINHSDEYVKYSEKFCDYSPYDIDPREWINLIANAEYVLTDSFHGTVFSILFNKSFFAFRRMNKKSKISTNSRLDSLLEISGISKKRILSGNENPKDVINNEINYKQVNENIRIFRDDSKNWLLNAIKWKQTNDHIEVDWKECCCGCTACENICPTKAISMKKDTEGFLYPLIDENKCIKCGKCIKACPILNTKERAFTKKAFIFQNGEEIIRKESTSGGAFSAVAKKIIQKNGIVCGAAFDENYKVIHILAEKENELYKFRNSKYVQSELGNIYSKIKELLNQGREVCFSGTSCQIEGLKFFLGKEYENLFLIDVVCRAVPSPLVWEKYLNLRKKEYKNINRILFRDKYYGYIYSNLSIYTNDRKDYHSGIETDPYLRAFFSNICDRPSCYECKFKKKNRESDLTIWDCFEVEKYNTSFDDKGTTRIMCNSPKGLKMIETLKDDNKVDEISVEEALSDFNHLYNRVRYNPKREIFFKDLNSISEEKLFNKYFPNNLKCKVERFARIALIKIGIYKPLLKLGKMIRKRI